MKRFSVTFAALAACTAAALPAAASGGNGGATYDPQPAPDARTADYRPVKATWYGPGFFGHKTACGKTLTRRTLGVAHKRLPCGTKVALSYRGRTITVPVVDRGPFARGIEYDLTYATARSIGMTQTSRLRAAALRD